MASTRDLESGFTESTPILHAGTRKRDRGSSSGCSRFWHAIGNSCSRCSPVVPARYSFASLGFFGMINVYAMRVNLSVALVAMVGKMYMEHSSNENTACRELLSPVSNTTMPINPTYTEFNWTPGMQSHVLGSFFYGYVITQIPGGILAEKYGAKWLFGLGVLITSIFTLLTPVAAHHSVYALMAVRFIEGLGEGVTFPAMNVLIGRWVPKLERSRISTIIFMGSPIGTVLSLSVSGYISSSDRFGGWPMVFYLFGTLGCIWFLFWIFLIHESPDVHPTISKSELQYIRSGQDQTRIKSSGPIPWRSILTSRPVWALAVTHFGYSWGFYTLLTELPSYLANILHYDLKQNGLLSAAPYVCQAIFAFSASGVADKTREAGQLKITTIRKIMNSIAFYLPGILVGAVAFTGCQSNLIVGLIVASVAFSGFMYSGFNVTHVDMSPEFAGTLMGITNCIANTTGFLAPAYVGWFINEEQTVRSWGIIFLTTTAVYFITGTIYNIFASAELQPWGVSTPPSPLFTAPTVPIATEEVPDDRPTNEHPSEKKSIP